MTSVLAPRSGLPGRLDDYGYTLPADLSFDEWVGVMGTLQVMERSVKWWVGDAILFGEAAYGHEASQAFPDAFSGSPYAESTLRAAAWVSAAFPRGTRVEGVSWTHHRVVAELPLPEATKLLKEAAAVNTAEGGEYVSSRDLIQKAERVKDKLRGRAIDAAGAEVETADLCWVPTVDELVDEVRRAVLSNAPTGSRRHVWIAGAIWTLVWSDQKDAFLEWKGP